MPARIASAAARRRSAAAVDACADAASARARRADVRAVRVAALAETTAPESAWFRAVAASSAACAEEPFCASCFQPTENAAALTIAPQRNAEIASTQATRGNALPGPRARAGSAGRRETACSEMGQLELRDMKSALRRLPRRSFYSCRKASIGLRLRARQVG